MKLSTKGFKIIKERGFIHITETTKKPKRLNLIQEMSKKHYDYIGHLRGIMLFYKNE